MRDARHAVTRHPFAGLFVQRSASSRRASSFDRTGGNKDFVRIGPGEVHELLSVDGPGCITKLYCAFILPDPADYRHAILRCYWDGSATPSVEVPLGDFFGIAHARVREFTSAFLSVNGGCGGTHGLNAYLPMPFSDGALVTIENRGDVPLGGVIEALWYHVDYEVYSDPLPDDIQRFHASFSMERSTEPIGPQPNVQLHDGKNVDGAANYVALDTAGQGRMVGLLLEIENIQGPIWYGEGDDMVFIDGEAWPPSIHGTGTEEIFGGGACPNAEYASLYSGFHLVGSPAFDGLVGMYRWYAADPLNFSRSIRWTIEHGHANNFQANYASVAYWYQEPIATLPPFPDAASLTPPRGARYDEAREAVFRATRSAVAREAATGASGPFFDVCRAAAPLYHGDHEAAIAAVAALR